tara:strand:- start:460 stop:729 length:270 start_codon:yes stop_codon:yes gene_type:complete
MEEKIKKEYFKHIVNEYMDGKAKIQGDHPEEIKTAIDTFFHAAKLLVDNPEVDTIPPEYVNKLLSALGQHPQYHSLLLDLLGIIAQGEE